MSDVSKRLLSRQRPLVSRGSASVAAPGASYYDGVFERVADFQVPPVQSRFFPLWALLVRHVSRTGARVLEVGCGTGQLAQLLREHGVASYCGFDFSEKGVEMARAREPDLEFRVADARESASYDGFDYNLVVSTEVLEHLDDDGVVFRNIRPRTRILFSVPVADASSHVRFFPTLASVQDYYAPLVRRMKVGRVKRWWFVQGLVRAS